MSPAVIHNVIHILTAFFALAAFIIALYKHVPGKLRKMANKIAELELDVSELFQRAEQTTAAQKRLNSRLAMQTAREKNKDEPSDPTDFRIKPNETVQEWKARCRSAIASGALKHAD